MKLVLVERDGAVVEPGLLVDGGVVPVGGLLPAGAVGQEAMEILIGGFAGLREGLQEAARAKPIDIGELRLLPPLPRPRTILCAIGNYWEHVERDPLPLRMFLKNPDAVIGPGDTIGLPPTTDPWIFMHEAELAIVLRGVDGPVAESSWRDAVFGYTCLVDVSARGEGRTSWGDYSWLGKSFDSFCPLGPCIVTADEIEDPNDLRVRLWVDQELRHDYDTADMEHRVPELVAWASRRVRLRSGDLIACGTNHEGLGPVQDGERVVIEIDRIGSMTVAVGDPLRRRWEQGIYMGRDSTNHGALARHGIAVRARARKGGELR